MSAKRIHGRLVDDQQSAAGIDLPQPTSDAERLVVAATCRAHLGFDDSDLPFLVDTVDDKVARPTAACPTVCISSIARARSRSRTVVVPSASSLANWNRARADAQ